MAQMIESGLSATRRDGKIDARVVQHPLRIVGLGDGRLGRKQRAVEPDRLDNVLDGHMDMQALHWRVFPSLASTRAEELQTPAPQPRASPWQQFSVR